MPDFQSLSLIVDQATSLPPQQILGAVFGSFCLGRALGALHKLLTSEER
ncbi:hypothetical protein M2323_000868 [Rhodoblastus acidophilus]|nr:hypothetical protein [Rhodoblastus acidophilus]MCW2282985.1 hypothetical protein [Rhodoblastus acidophilus]MCW2331964.1 hypothetical protein [Rhodoblastus acidophilus]